MLRYRCGVAVGAWAACLAISLSVCLPVTAQDRTAADRAALVKRAVEYLQNRGQAEDGSFSRQTGPAVTALVVAGLLRNGRSAEEPWIARSLDYLMTFQQRDGGFYQKGSLYGNYETSVVMMCLAEANRDGRYQQQLKGAERYLVGAQWDESEGEEPSSFNYGGAGYGKPQASRPIEHLVLDRRVDIDGRRRPRGARQGAAVRQPLSESRKPGEYDALSREESRWRILLHARRGRFEPGWDDRQRRPA